jgi:5'-nucleotidase
VVQRVILQGLPPYTLLNVNVPDLPSEQIKGYAITRQGMRIYNDVLGKDQDEDGVHLLLDRRRPAHRAG